MRSKLARLGDVMLSRILPAGEAGACIPENGQKCYCGSPCGTDYCTQYYFNCTGTCVKHGSNRC